MPSSCRSLRRGKENIRVEGQDVGTLKRVGVNVMSVHADGTISAARRMRWRGGSCVDDVTVLASSRGF